MKKKCTQLGKRIKSLRELTGLSQTKYAVKVGINRTASISDYENGKREPELTTLCKISEFSNVSLDWLLAGKEPERQPETSEEKSLSAELQILLKVVSVMPEVAQGETLEAAYKIKEKYKEAEQQRESAKKALGGQEKTAA